MAQTDKNETRLRRVVKDTTDAITALNRLSENIPPLIYADCEKMGWGSARAADYTDDFTHAVEAILFHLSRWKKEATEQLSNENKPVTFSRATKPNPSSSSAGTGDSGETLWKKLGLPVPLGADDRDDETE